MICTTVHKKLKEAFLSLLEDYPIEEISVKKVIERSKVSKSTFYTNYDNMEDFITDQIDSFFRPIECDTELYKVTPGSKTCVFVAITEAFMKDPVFLRSVCDSKYKSVLMDNIDYFFEERLNYCFSSNLCSMDKETISKKKIFLAAGYKGMIENYLKTDDITYLQISADIIQETIESYALGSAKAD